ncbi:MAG: ribosome maturation factor RimM [Armatimonadota bacterium]|nr:ribosome maturation factor RimM [Armatimonadota bacterium]MDR7428057.1 ribosome maturation factor RimM [Armatimonadota bacterium]MDR7470882.1 ribosome maturation factor RimM [Armatimonadota bacterium]MDR7475817.1 ribosome maturation factor RimM [Armatimonadota bacterium]MDR7538797.1 ribosome maturation factor RimM [Armatimonadota bacterium]
MPAGTAPPTRLIIGRITRPHGVRGEVKVRPETDFPQRFARLRRVLLLDQREATAREAAVEAVRHQGEVVLLKLAGVDDLEAARALQGWAVAVPWEERVPLPQDSYYLVEVLGLRVRTPSGEVLGTVTEVLRTAAHDVYRVAGEAGEVFVPATREVVRAVDLERGEMVVVLPEGLL